MGRQAVVVAEVGVDIEVEVAEGFDNEVDTEERLDYMEEVVDRAKVVEDKVADILGEEHQERKAFHFFQPFFCEWHSHELYDTCKNPSFDPWNLWHI